MSRPLRVLHVSQPVDGGVAAVVRTLCADQHDRGWDVRLACPPGPLADDAASAGVAVSEWTATRSPGRSVPAEARRLAAVVADSAPDVVHLHSAKAGLAGRLAVRGRRPTLFQPHAWSFDAVTGPVAGAARAWERFAERWTDRLLCVSADELATGRRIGITAAARVVPNGVDLERFPVTGPQGPRAELGLGDGPLVLCLGRVTEQKGQDLLLQAWPLVRDRVPGARLVVVGDGPDAGRLRAACTDPSVLWRPATDDPSPYYRAADVVALPSRWEGMPLVALEAIASGRPVVGFDVSGIGEAIGGAGTVVEPGDVGSLADALVRRLTDPGLAAAEGTTGRSRAARLFERSVITDRVAEIVTELAGREWPTSSARRPATRNERPVPHDIDRAG